MTKVAKISFIVALFVSLVYAQEAADSVDTVRTPGAKSEMTALNLSIGCTVIPYLIGYKIAEDNDRSDVGPLIVFSSIALGPSAGHLYAKQWGRGLGMAALRTATLSIGIAFINEGLFAQFFGGTSGDDAAYTTGSVFLLAAAGLALFDIFTAPASVRRYNASLESSGKAFIVPYVDPINEHYGLSFVYQF